MELFKHEVVREFEGIKIVWYPREGACLILRRKSKRFYKNIPKKYIGLFRVDKYKGGKNANRIKN